MSSCRHEWEHEWKEEKTWIEENGRWYEVIFRKCKKCGERRIFYIDETSIVPDG